MRLPDIQVYAVATGEELVQKRKEIPNLDLVVTDVFMPPGATGIEASRIIGDYESQNGIRRVPIVAVTGFGYGAPDQKMLVQDALASGIERCPAKPVTPEMLDCIMTTYLFPTANYAAR